jgi:hypothetical protein
MTKFNKKMLFKIVLMTRKDQFGGPLCFSVFKMTSFAMFMHLL